MDASAKGRVMKANDVLNSWAFGPIDANAMRVLAEVLNDPNPIHLDASAVRAAGLGERVINQGPANLAYVLNMLEGNGLEIRALEATFTGNVRAGDVVEASGAVTSVEGDHAQCKFSLTLDDGVKAIIGAAVCAPTPDGAP
ncbi:hypothetical protein U91I_01384 [alpha proteobacterium U9-1i]|nr:hypothetical protein U91I_01384 [alpha proteobacterium U9-1i]